MAAAQAPQAGGAPAAATAAAVPLLVVRGLMAHGRAWAPGDVVEVDRALAAALVAAGKASHHTPPADTAPALPTDQAAPTDPPDESALPVAEPPAPSEPPAPPAPARRR